MFRLMMTVWAVAGLATACTVAPVTRPTPTRHTSAVISVYLRDDATAAQKHTIEEALRSRPGVESVTYVSREEAYRQFKKAFEDEPIGENVRPEDLSNSYRVRVEDRSDAPSTVKAARGLSGVESAKIAPRPSMSPTP